MRHRRADQRRRRQVRREDARRRVAIASTCRYKQEARNHVPHKTETEIKHNLWEAECVFCHAKIYKRTSDVDLFDPWMTSMITIVEWP